MELTTENRPLELRQTLIETKRRQILILEDDPALRRILWKTFTGWGWFAAAAASLEEAKLLAAQKTAFDLIVSDYHLPDGTGLDLMRWLLDQGNSPPPFILMSADARIPFHSHVKPLQKPFSVEELRVLVDMLLGFRGHKATLA